ncbi:DUF3108 domain-containing protein [Paraburkholderia sp. GAS42]|uniref:DUF3108 domain-containing protein n=1 Tax=Paraburkholderia sp. GAS42 TaxID=3035135 RepID=UPI003D22D5C2
MLSHSAASRPDRSPRNAASAPPAPSARRRVRAMRWGCVLIVVVVLHWIAAQWLERHRDASQPVDAAHAPVQVALLKPERVEQAPASVAPTHSATPAPPSHAQKQSERVLTIARPEATHTTPADGASAASASSETTSAESGSGASAAAGSATSNTGAAQSSPGVKFAVPPSSDLKYDTFYNGVRNQPGTIHWTTDGRTYEMVVSVPLPFVGTFSYSSHGHVDAFGIAPDQYIEKRGRRPEDMTIFNREAKQIAFTRTPTTLALPDGAQDRFSMVMQLASLVRGDPAAYTPGVTREFYVADSDSGEIWPIETIGDEGVRIPGGFVEARHFMRLPRREGDRRRIDVWLAPSLGWLPARLVQTEPNGTQIELVWRGKLAAPDSNSDTSPASSNDGTSDSPEPSADPGGAIEKP